MPTQRLTVVVKQELERRIGDLENAMRTIGRIVADPGGGSPLQRRERIIGVLTMYNCAPASVPADAEDANAHRL